MKFQYPSLNFFLNGRKDGRMNKRTSRNQYAPHFFKVGGIKTGFLMKWLKYCNGQSCLFIHKNIFCDSLLSCFIKVILMSTHNIGL